MYRRKLPQCGGGCSRTHLGATYPLTAERLKPEKLRSLAEEGSYDDALWGETSELGWPGIFIGEEYGGQELGVVELAILCEELGYALAPSPFLSNAAAGLVIQHAGPKLSRYISTTTTTSAAQNATPGFLRSVTVFPSRPVEQ